MSTETSIPEAIIAWTHTLEYAATALEASSDNGDQYCAHQIREHLAAAPDLRAHWRAEVIEELAKEQERMATQPRALTNKAAQFKRLIFATWLHDRAARERGEGS